MDVYQRRRLVALSALAGIFIIIVLLIRSCGGDDETTSTPLAGTTGGGGATVISQADYIDQADAICLEANTSLAAVDQSDAAQAASDEADIVAGQLQQLQSLPAPDDGTTKLDNYLSAFEKQANAYQDRATAADRGDDAAMGQLDATIDKAQEDAANSAENFGFKVCGTDKAGDSSSADTSGGGGDTSDTSTSATDTGEAVAPATTTAVAPATTTPAAPVTPAPTDDTGGAGTPAPVAPSDGGSSSSSGGVSP